MRGMSLLEVPIRLDDMTEISSESGNIWMASLIKGLNNGKFQFGYNESAAVEQILGIRLNRPLIGEMPSATALNGAAQDIQAVFQTSAERLLCLSTSPNKQVEK